MPTNRGPGLPVPFSAPGDALERIRTSCIDRNENITVIGIAGPGDPLANEATFEVLGAINREFPEIILCVSTNGLLLPEKLDDLLRSGVRSHHGNNECRIARDSGKDIFLGNIQWDDL